MKTYTRMKTKLDSAHDSIVLIENDAIQIRVVFNRDVVYYINVETMEIDDYEGLYDVNPKDLAVMQEVISPDIHVFTLKNETHETHETHKLISFESSHGWLVVDENGYPVKDKCIFEKGEWLESIVRVDIEELINYYKLCGLEYDTEWDKGGDVLDFGYWTRANDGQLSYVMPDYDWRRNVFHNKVYDAELIESIINKSIVWVKENRLQD